MGMKKPLQFTLSINGYPATSMVSTTTITCCLDKDPVYSSSN
jgi:hypothetical protein